MKFENITLRIVVAALLILALLGIIAPMMFNSESDALVILGLFLATAGVILVVYWMLKPVFKLINEHFNNNQNLST